MARPIPSRVTFLLVLLFFLGFAVAVLAFIDLRWSHWLFPADDSPTRAQVSLSTVAQEAS